MNLFKFDGVLTILIVLLLITNSCIQTNSADSSNFEHSVRNEAINYFDTFSERSDWDKFLSFYREDVRFKDITLQLELDSLWKFKRFYKWDEEGDRFKKLYPEQEHLNIQSLVVEGNTVAAKGHLNPFYYDGTLIDSDWGMEFTIWLTFDENLKIIEQNDWMEYDAGTLENTIQRINNNGIDAIPNWLDLSKRE